MSHRAKNFKEHTEYITLQLLPFQTVFSDANLYTYRKVLFFFFKYITHICRLADHVLEEWRRIRKFKFPVALAGKPHGFQSMFLTACKLI